MILYILIFLFMVYYFVSELIYLTGSNNLLYRNGHVTDSTARMAEVDHNTGGLVKQSIANG